MVFVSVTRLKLKSVWPFIPFFRANEAAVKALTGMPGYIDGAELIDKGLVFWTLTAFESEAAMKAFRNGMPHLEAMRRISDWCSEAAYAHWMQEEAVLPTWDAAWERMKTEGRFTKLRKPSKRHANGELPAPKWKATRPLQKRKAMQQ